MAKLLLVDDEEILVQMYKKKFEDEDFEVEAAYNGEQGLEKLTQYRPDLVLLDVTMPKVDGITVLKKIKSDPQMHSIQVMLLTNIAISKEEEESVINLGAAAYLLKADYVPKDIVEKVKTILSLRPN